MQNTSANESKYKLPTASICIVVVLLLVFVSLMIVLMISKIQGIVNPLNNNIVNENVISSKYAEFAIIEKDDHHVIYVDKYTDVLYIELRSNGYSSALSVLLKEDGSPKKLSDY